MRTWDLKNFEIYIPGGEKKCGIDLLNTLANTAQFVWKWAALAGLCICIYVRQIPNGFLNFFYIAVPGMIFLKFLVVELHIETHALRFFVTYYSSLRTLICVSSLSIACTLYSCLDLFVNDQTFMHLI